MIDGHLIGVVYLRQPLLSPDPDDLSGAETILGVVSGLALVIPATIDVCRIMSMAGVRGGL